ESLAIYGVGWAKDGKSIAWGCVNKDTASGRAPLERTIRLDFVSNVRPILPEAVATYERATANNEGYTLRKVNATTVEGALNGDVLGRWKSPAGRVHAITLLSGSRAVIGCDFGLYLVDLRNGQTVREFVGHSGHAWAIAPAPDRKMFVTGSNDQTIRVWSPGR